MLHRPASRQLSDLPGCVHSRGQGLEGEEGFFERQVPDHQLTVVAGAEQYVAGGRVGLQGVNQGGVTHQAAEELARVGVPHPEKTELIIFFGQILWIYLKIPGGAWSRIQLFALNLQKTSKTSDSLRKP